MSAPAVPPGVDAPCWRPGWFDEATGLRAMRAWRGVEAQHVVSTLRLVDDLDEQALLEGLLERSKPPLPPSRAPQHYLLATPFRYRPLRESRFRRAGSLGVWYGAEDLQAACAEVAFWRHRFIADSAGLSPAVLLTEHTFFQARVRGRAIDLLSPPWVSVRKHWVQGEDYRQTQALAEAARTRGLQWIRYESARAPGGRCAAVLDVEALSLDERCGAPQTWHCKATRASVTLVRGAERYHWEF